VWGPRKGLRTGASGRLQQASACLRGALDLVCPSLPTPRYAALRAPLPSPQAEGLRSEAEASKADVAELEELRELKADVERKERQQAAIIEGQVRGRARLGGGAAGGPGAAR
jgi:hypothetical protein